MALERTTSVFSCSKAASTRSLPSSLDDSELTETYVYSWGDNHCGQCLLSASTAGSSGNTNSPQLVAGMRSGVHTLCAGWECSLLVNERGTLFAGGSNQNQCLSEEQGGDLLANGPCRVDLPELEDARFLAASAGRDHFLAVTQQGALYSWGASNEFDQCGHNQFALRKAMPRIVSLPRNPNGQKCQVSMVACGELHSLVLSVCGQLFSFGDNAYGQLGIGKEATGTESIHGVHGPLRNLPCRVIAAGAQHSMALSVSGQVFAWGNNRHGRCGLGVEFEGQDKVIAPAHVSDLQGVGQNIAAGGRHSAVIVRKGRLFLAGENEYGQLGHPAVDIQYSPLFLELPTHEYRFRVRLVALGEEHTLMLSYEGELFAMGRNTEGQLGIENSCNSVSEPQRIQVNRNASNPLLIWGVAAGQNHNIILCSPGPREHERLRSTQSVGNPSQNPRNKPVVVEMPLISEDSVCPSPEPPDEKRRRLDGAGSPLPLDQGEDEEMLPRALSSGCASPLSKSGKITVPLSPKTGKEDDINTTVVLLRPVAMPGKTTLNFASLTVENLQKLAGPSHIDELRTSISWAVACPHVLNASFCFPSLATARLNSRGLCNALTEIFRCQRDAGMLGKLEKQLIEDVASGLQQFSGESVRDLSQRDQVRCLAIYLLLPIWGTETSRSWTVFAELARAFAKLSASGRRNLRDLIADECGDSEIMREEMVKKAQAFANYTMAEAMKTKEIPSQVWDAVFMLQLLWSANSRAENAATATAVDVLSVVDGARPLGRQVRLDASVFAITSLDSFPPEVEIQCFQQNAKFSKVVSPDELMEDPTWEIPPNSKDLPLKFRSFMVNANLVPIGFKRKVLQVENILRHRSNQQRAVMSSPTVLMGFIDMSSLFFLITVKRNNILHDTAVAIQNASPEDLRKPLRIRFAGEDGVDEGGVKNEFFRILSKDIFSPDFGMFHECPDTRTLWFNISSFNEESDFALVGSLVGLAAYNNLPGLNFPFPRVLFKKLKRIKGRNLEDLAQVSPSHASSIQAVLTWTPPLELANDPKAADELFQNTFCLDFSASYEVFGEPQTVSLLTGELTTSPELPPVTLANRAEFADRLKDWILDTSIEKHFEAFHQGFSRVCDSPVFHCLTAEELEAIVSGERDLDFAKLRKNTQYEGYSAEDPYIKSFWEVLEAFDTVQKRQFLRFTTGSDITPVGGLEEIRLKIQKNGLDTDRLPTAHTCFSLFLLPHYRSKEKMKKMLIMAIENAEGFGLE